MKCAFAIVLGLMFAVWCDGARAQVYQCTAANGSVGFQDHACAHGQKQKLINVPSHPPPGYVPPPAAAAASSVSDASALPALAYVLPPPAAPLPVLYACVGAVNGKQYLTRSPPPPYLAPLGVMGYPSESLAQVYGPHGGGGVGKPTPIGGPRIATGMTEVQDYCLPATHAEVCSYVQKKYDENDHKLRMAMPREQPPFEQREQQLASELKNC
ncbi:MAG: DUF4124 domain-containing protein [Rhodanobacteraceae bacterium]|nr:MAG: DUF4124 domain-containing protein [Rhodanobacteraceae bacterium]